MTSASSPSAPPSRDGVSVKLNASNYRTGQRIDVAVANGSSKTVYTDDFKTECTIVTLQRHDGGSWTDILGCRLGRPTMTISIAPGGSRTVSLEPTSFHLDGSVGPGTYRIKFGYRLTNEVGGDDPLVAYSAEFRVT